MPKHMAALTGKAIVGPRSSEEALDAGLFTILSAWLEQRGFTAPLERVGPHKPGDYTLRVTPQFTEFEMGYPDHLADTANERVLNQLPGYDLHPFMLTDHGDGSYTILITVTHEMWEMRWVEVDDA